MILLDVNVILYALRREFPQHAVATEWLTAQLAGPEGIVVPDGVLASATRLLTHHRVLSTPLTPTAALAALSVIRSAPAVVHPPRLSTRWDHFHRFVDDLGLRANDIPDALLAATAMSLGARLATFDRGFRRFPGLQLIEPTSSAPGRQ